MLSKDFPASFVGTRFRNFAVAVFRLTRPPNLR